MKKNAVQSVTLWGLVIALVPIIAAIQSTGWTTENLTLLSGWIVAVIGRVRQGDLTLLPAKPPVPPALLVICALALSACAAPASEQGRASQGGSTGQQPVVNLSFAFGGDIHVTGTSSATAAPSAASEAQARQDAKQDTSVPIDASGVIPAAGATKALGGLVVPKVPTVKPIESVVPVKEDAPPKKEEAVPPPMAPVGEVK